MFAAIAGILLRSYSYEVIMRILRYIISYVIFIFGIPLSFYAVLMMIKSMGYFSEGLVYVLWLAYFAVCGFLVYVVNRLLNRLGDKYKKRGTSISSYLLPWFKKIPPIVLLALLFILFKVGVWAIDLIIINPQIEYIRVSVIQNAGIGDDWRFIVEINGETVSTGTKVKPINGKYRIKATAIEQDTHSDINSNSVIIDNEDIGKENIKVVVYETKGRGAGKTATVEFTFEIDD